MILRHCSPSDWLIDIRCQTKRKHVLPAFETDTTRGAGMGAAAFSLVKIMQLLAFFSNFFVLRAQVTNESYHISIHSGGHSLSTNPLVERIRRFNFGEP